MTVFLYVPGFGLNCVIVSGPFLSCLTKTPWAIVQRPNGEKKVIDLSSEAVERLKAAGVTFRQEGL